MALSPAEKARLASSRAVDPRAHDEYLKGRHELFTFSVERFPVAVAHFERAIAIDPAHAPSHAGLAEAHMAYSDLALPPREAVARARPAAERALELDDSLAEAHLSLAMIKAYYDWDWKGAEAEFRRALTLNPNSAWLNDWYGWFLTLLGRAREAIAPLERARELDPLSPAIASDLGTAHFFLGDYARATNLARRAIELDARFWPAGILLAWIHQRRGDLPRAILELEKLPDAEIVPVVAELGGLYARAGRRADAERMLDNVRTLSRAHYVSPLLHAQLYASLGRTDTAFEWLEKGVEERSSMLALWIRVGPMFDPLRADPRFADIKRRMNIPS